MPIKIKKQAPVVIASMLALSLNFIGASQAQAAVCSASDQKYFKDWNSEFETAFYAGSTQAGWDASELFNIAEVASKKSKSKKMKAAWKKLLIEMENDPTGFPLKWSYTNSGTGKQSDLIGGLIKFKRC